MDDRVCKCPTLLNGHHPGCAYSDSPAPPVEIPPLQQIWARMISTGQLVPLQQPPDPFASFIASIGTGADIDVEKYRLPKESVWPESPLATAVKSSLRMLDHQEKLYREIIKAHFGK